MAFFNAAEAQLLDGIFTIFGATLYVGLSSTTPTDAGANITEPSGGGYARQPVTAAEFAAAVAGAPSSKATDTAIDYGTASATWLAGANLTHIVVFDALTVGTPVLYAPLSTPKPVISGDPVSVGAGDLVVELGSVAEFA